VQKSETAFQFRGETDSLKRKGAPTIPGGRGSLEPEIIYKDSEILVIDKPAGLLAVPIGGSRAPSAQKLLLEKLSKGGSYLFPVHRIDRYTSGLMVFARTRHAMSHLARQFRSHSPRRIYLAIVRGGPVHDQGELRDWLKLVKRGFRQLVVGEGEGGTLAITRFKVLERFEGATLLEAQLITGLKNQIRAQFAHHGMALWGDRHYSPSERWTQEMDRQALHSWRLGFVHPKSGKYVEFECPPPEDFKRLLERLRQRGHAGSSGR
jgi:23S rRNA pseudouridine1911/1915/1917 synthase